MTMLLKDLDKDATLLMYLAGELPDEARTQVERMLAGDVDLRRSLEALREAYGGAEVALRWADRSQPLAFSAATAARRFGQEVRSKHARNLALAPVATQLQRPRRVPLWAYPLASAAAVLIAFVWWYGTKPVVGPYAHTAPSETLPPVTPPVDAGPVSSDASPAELYAYDGGAWSGANVLAEPAESDSELALSEAEDELYALSDPADDDDDVSTFLMLGEIDEQ